MAVRTIECTECGTTVPYGRLSCPTCGELLASVAGAARRLTSLVAIEPDAVEATPVVSPTTTTLHDQVADASPDDVRSASAVWSTPPFPPQPTITVAPPAETPGAYVPPAPVPATGPLMGDMITAGLPAPARAWAGSATAAAGTLPTADGALASRPAVERSLTDPARRVEAIDWIAVAGAAIAAVGFLLPWARTIIGADGVGYLDTWGFAGPGHVVVVAGMLVVLGLAAAETRIPAWVRLGIPGLVLSALVIGLVWPYVLGPLGPLPGAYLSLAGSGVLGAAAVAALAVDRHAGRAPSV